jgi:hypothetical protein
MGFLVHKGLLVSKSPVIAAHCKVAPLHSKVETSIKTKLKRLKGTPKSVKSGPYEPHLYDQSGVGRHYNCDVSEVPSSILKVAHKRVQIVYGLTKSVLDLHPKTMDLKVHWQTSALSETKIFAEPANRDWSWKPSQRKNIL